MGFDTGSAVPVVSGYVTVAMGEIAHLVAGYNHYCTQL